LGTKITVIDSKNSILLQAGKTSDALSQKPNIALFLQPLKKFTLDWASLA
jgi:hypothetical protein